MKNKFEIRGNVTAIFLNRKDGTELETLISTSDLEKVMEFKNTWCATFNKNTNSFYVLGSLYSKEDKKKMILLHRFLLDDPNGFLIDHKNNDTLDNRRNNLRFATNSENQQNRKSAQRDNKSGVRGVYWNKHAKSWHARIKLNGKCISVGYFKEITDAENAVTQARKQNMPYSKENQGA
jgi:hypothetical protein